MAGGARAASLVLGTISLIVGSFILLIVVWLAGQVVVPFYDVVTANEATQAIGWAEGVGNTIEFGMKYGFPLIGGSMVFWLLWVGLSGDSFFGQTR